MQTDVAFTQGDYGEAKLTIAVKDNEQYITGDTGASISFLRADGNIVTGDLTGTKGMYAYTFKGNELEAAGKIVATVTIKYTGGRVSAAAFAFTVRYNPTYDRKIPAGPYITELEKIKEQAQTYVEYLSALIEQLQPDIGSTALTKADLINGYTQTVAGIKAFDAAAAKTLKELVDGKIDATKIVNNLLSTDASMVLSAAIGPIIDQRLTDLLEKYNRLNGDLGTIKFKAVSIPESEYLESEKLKLGLSDFGVSIGYSVNYIVKVSGRFDAILIGNISASNNYSSQLLISSGDILNYRSKTSGTWKDWQSLSKA